MSSCTLLATIWLLAAGVCVSAPMVGFVERESEAAVREEPSPRPIPLLSVSGRSAFDVLLTAQRFVDGTPCAGIDTPAVERALWSLSREHHAGAAYTALLDRATLAGRLLALCGLRDADPESFRTEVARYRGMPATVPARLGCVEGDVPVANLVEWTHGPAVRLSATLRTVDDWFEAHPGTAMLDIVGGGYTQSLREERWTGVQLGTKEAYNVLHRPGSFQHIPCGIARTPPLIVAAMRKLIRDQETELLCRLFERSPTWAGQLYALCGLWACAPDAFERCALQLELTAGRAQVRVGCVYSPVSTMVAEIRKGELPRRLLSTY